MNEGRDCELCRRMNGVLLAHGWGLLLLVVLLVVIVKAALS